MSARVDQEPRVEIIIPDGKNIKPAVLKYIGMQGFEYRERNNGNSHLDVLNSPVSFTFLNQPDVFRRVDAGFYHGGFSGEEAWLEHLASLGEGNSPKLQRVQGKFDFFEDQDLKLSILVRNNRIDNRRYRTIIDLAGKTLLTTYPALMREYLTPYFLEAGKEMPIIDGNITGKEERELANGNCEAVGVIVASGKAMREAVARELVVVRHGIQGVLIFNPDLLRDAGSQRAWNKVVDNLQRGIHVSEGGLMPNFPGFSQVLTEVVEPVSPQAFVA